MVFPITSRFNAGFCEVPSLTRALTQDVVQPTLIAVGEAAEGSAGAAALVAPFVAGMPQARAKVLPGAKRLLPWQNPEALCDAIADFVGEGV